MPLKTESESEVTQSCLTLCNPMDCSLPGSSVHGIFQAIVLEWIAISFSRGSSRPRNRTRVSRIVDRCFIIWATREVLSIGQRMEFIYKKCFNGTAERFMSPLIVSSGTWAWKGCFTLSFWSLDLMARPHCNSRNGNQIVTESLKKRNQRLRGDTGTQAGKAEE